MQKIRESRKLEKVRNLIKQEIGKKVKVKKRNKLEKVKNKKIKQEIEKSRKKSRMSEKEGNQRRILRKNN